MDQNELKKAILWAEKEGYHRERLAAGEGPIKAEALRKYAAADAVRYRIAAGCMWTMLEAQAREAAMEEDMREIAMGYDACVYCAHCCRDGAPVYRSGEEDGEFCTLCDSDYCNFEWRGMRADGAWD